MNYYRKFIKSESKKEQFNGKIPDKREMLEPSTQNDDSSFGNMMINIGENHYKNYNSNSKIEINSNNFDSDYRNESYSNSNNNSDNKFTSISSNYKNDERFASVSSQPFDPDAEVEVHSTTTNKIFSFLGSAFKSTKYVASAVTERVKDIDFASKLEVTFNALKYTGSKVYEKSSDIYSSDTFQTIKDKASDGISYIKEKVFSKDDHFNKNSSQGKYSSYSSDNYKNEDSNNNGGSYYKMGENLLDQGYTKY